MRCAVCGKPAEPLLKPMTAMVATALRAGIMWSLGLSSSRWLDGLCWCGTSQDHCRMVFICVGPPRLKIPSFCLTAGGCSR